MTHETMPSTPPEPARTGPPPPPGPPAEPPTGRTPRGWSRWRRRYRVLAVAGALVVAALLAPAPVVAPLVDRAAYGYEGDCAEFTGVEVDSGAWPVVGRAVVGRLRDVSTHADRIRFDNGFTIHDVDFRADEVGGPPLRFGLVDADAEVRGGISTATVRFADLEDMLATFGATVELEAGDGSLVAQAEVPFVGVVPTTVDLVPVDGDLELQFTAYDAFALPALQIAFPEPVELDGIEVVEDGIRVTSTVDGTITSEDWGCDTATGEAPA